MKDKCDHIWTNFENIVEFSPTNYISRLWLKKVGRHLEGDVLDVGCGDCSRSLAFLDMDKASYVGIDHSEVAVTKAKNKGVECYRMSATDIKLNKEFDYILSLDNLEHINEDKKCLDNMYKHLKPSGQLILLTALHQKYWGSLDTEAGHCRRYNPDEVIQMIKDSGFKINKVYYKGFPLGGLYRDFQHFLGKGKGENKNDIKYVPKGNILKTYISLAPLILPIFRIDMLFSSSLFKSWSRGIIVLAEKPKDVKKASTL